MTERDRPKVNITPEMINSGVEILCAYDPRGDSMADAVVWIFEAMYGKLSQSSDQSARSV
jgi:hypothetical protein